MANLLFQRQQQSQTPQQQTILFHNQLNQIKQQGPSNILFNQMYQNNPQFKQFADNMRGKTPEQAFEENGLDFNQFKNMKW